MKTTIMTIFFIIYATVACAFEVTFPMTPVYGTISDSYSNDVPPINSAFGGVLLAGGSNGSLTKALTQLGVRTHTTAQAGATSFDQYDEYGNIVFYGLEKQLDQLLVQTTWFDGISRLDTVIIGPMMNDCSHTRDCTYEDMDNYVAISVHVADRALNAGKNVIYVLPPEWEKLHLAEAVSFYGITQVINETDYNIWRDKNINAMCSIPNIKCIDAYHNMSTDDGLHPTYQSYLTAASMILEN